MTDELIEQLRARNPKPTPTAPPIDRALARIAADQPSARWRRARWLGPAMAVGVAIAVAVVVLVATRGGRHAVAPGHTTGGQVLAAGHHRRPPLRIETISAMRGALQVPVLGFASGGAGVIAWQQFPTPKTRKPTGWMATSTNGRSWSAARREYSLLTDPEFEGVRDGWATAVGPDRTVEVYATHDGGTRWAPASRPAAVGPGPRQVSVAGGEVWAVGTRSCASTGCQWIVMHGAASGNDLFATHGQPLPRTNQNRTTISAVSATTAYVSTPARLGDEIYATHDGGRDWRRIKFGCGDGQASVGAIATPEDTLWQMCNRGRYYQVTRTGADGEAVTTWRLPFVLATIGFEPVSSKTAWAQSEHGEIYRTTDGGHTWQQVWTPGGPHGGASPGLSQELSAQDSEDATLLVSITHGPVASDRVPRSTSLILYRTTNGGRTWWPTPLRLPHS